MQIILIVKNATISRKASDLIITWAGKTTEVSTHELELLIIMGSNVTLSSSVLLFLASIGVPVVINGKIYDSVLVSPFLNTMSEIRAKQYLMSDNDKLYLAKKFIEGKILSMNNLMKYFSYLRKIQVNPVKISFDKVSDIDSLRVREAEMSKKAWEELSKFFPNFSGRKPRNNDPINRGIDYAYSIIYGLCTHALIAVGFDPYFGVMHKNMSGRVSFTYDFSEMFKPIGIHAVFATKSLSLDSNGYLSKDSALSVTKHLYDIIVKKKIKSAIYRKGNELKKFVMENKDFTPFAYKP
ncbi:CRISPR-associated endonuclease Cas1 [Metallosphaera javensis (ex Sakai et al. 2022)]|uniref:CRISPR-associated endonuclease Cas1 n=1 Tax=Metallosphaera javensis (ex Sakai et al. 2022) TaxID=2775498 RepID=UPI00258B4608|nr:MAG: CRISPR-associated protein Cas1 [Metallosphaera javensis (ex Sakai et al. 2022)]